MGYRMGATMSGKLEGKPSYIDEERPIECKHIEHAWLCVYRCDDTLDYVYVIRSQRHDNYEQWFITSEYGDIEHEKAFLYEHPLK